VARIEDEAQRERIEAAAAELRRQAEVLRTVRDEVRPSRAAPTHDPNKPLPIVRPGDPEWQPPPSDD
jgi:hypothetical protein